MTTALNALNHIENGHSVLVCVPGCLSSLFGIVGDVIVSGNSEIGVAPTDKTKGEIYQHFAAMLADGGELVLL